MLAQAKREGREAQKPKAVRPIQAVPSFSRRQTHYRLRCLKALQGRSIPFDNFAFCGLSRQQLGRHTVGVSKVARKRRFQLVLVKPSHYDDDGYVIRWWRALIPSNSLAAVYGLALDSAQRQVPMLSSI